MQKTTKASEVSYISHYNKGMNDWSSYQPMSATARGDDSAQTGLGGSASLVKKKKAPAPPPPKETVRAYSVLPPPTRTGGSAAPAVRAEKTEKRSSSSADGGARQSSSTARPGGDVGNDETDAAAAPLPNPPSAPEMDAKTSALDDANHQAAAFRLRRELDHLHLRAESEIQGRDHEISRLKAQVALLKEKVTNQSVELKDCLRALDEVKRENAAEVQMCRREGALAERRASSMQARLGAAAANSERVFASANAQLEAMKAERTALAEALAEIASAAAGGPGATREELAMDAEAAVAEGFDPLPKRNDSWLKYSYGADHGQGKHGFGHGRSGGRAVQSLVGAVSRLHRRCRDALDAERRQRGLARELEAALNGMTAKYNAVEDATMTLFDHAVTAQQLCGIVGLAPSKVEKGIVGRLKQVAHILDHVHGAFEEHKGERARMHAQIIELDFYSKLHLKLLEQAKNKVGVAEHQLVLDDDAAVHDAPVQKEVSQDDAAQDDAPQDEESPKEVSQDDAAQDDAPQDEESPKEDSQDDAPQDDATQEEESPKEDSQDDAPQDDATQEDESPKEDSQDDATQDEESPKEDSQDDAPQDDVLQEEESPKEESQDDAVQDDVLQAEESPKEESQDDAVQDDAAQANATQYDATQEEESQKEESQDDAVQGDATNATQDDAPREEETQDDAPQVAAAREESQDDAPQVAVAQES